MNPYERLLAEELPTGTFGGPRPTTPPQPYEIRQPVTPEQAAHNAAALHDALDGWHYDDHPHRHLHAIPTNHDTNAA